MNDVIPKTPAPDFKKYDFIYRTGRRGGKLQKKYGLRLNATYFGEYYRDSKNILITFNRISIKDGKICLITA